ncbi:MAG TPA: alpha/beta fold hydrolase [Thermoanaerobaculia bacterium]|nr:alpha/beta fold hydrolase [Thermoanaerobaculia bacterium]
MKKLQRRLAAILLLALPSSAALAAVPEPAAGDCVLRDFRFGTGETLPELKIHYRTLGAPRRNARGVVENAVLILHGTTGSGKQFFTENFAGVLFGPGQLLDATKYYLIVPDGIGHGESSRPSEGLRMRFPRYTYDDMVAAQYRLLTEGLKVDHLRLVLGTSMGGMHVWVWGEKYPEFMDGLVPLAALPGPMSGRNRAWRRMILDAIREDPEWKNGDYETQPRGLTNAVHLLVLMLGNPVEWQKAAPTREEADRYLAAQTASRMAGQDANNFLYAFDASRDYDPSTGLEKIEKPLLAINFADDLINPPELGILETAVARVRRGRAVVIPAGPATRGHGTHSLPAVWQEYLRAFLAALTP